MAADSFAILANSLPGGHPQSAAIIPACIAGVTEEDGGGGGSGGGGGNPLSASELTSSSFPIGAADELCGGHMLRNGSQAEYVCLIGS